MPGQAAPIADLREELLGYLAQQRYGLRLTAYGLNDEQARTAPTSSTLTVGGLIKHLTFVERGWMDNVLQRQKEQSFSESTDDYLDNFRLSAGETLAGVLADYEAAAAETDEIVRRTDLDQPVPVPKGVPWYPEDLEAWSVRWVVLHLISETARHAGHADIVREGIDGATAYPLMAAAEDWPATPWLQPWSPAT